MQLVNVERRPPVRLATLDTGTRNPLTLDAVRALRHALAPDPEAPVVVLGGRDDAFCAGLDNATLAKGAYEREELLAAMAELLVTAISGPTRIVAACRGHAVAAGAMLLLVADIRMGSRGAYKVGFTEPGLGMPLPELPALLARERINRRRLHEVTALGRTLSPDEAVDAGFLDEVVGGDRLDELAEERGREIAALPDPAYQGTVASVWGATLARMDELVKEQIVRRDAARAR